VQDPVLRKKLTPDFTLGCKRVLLSNTYLPAVTRPNVDVVTTGIAEVRASSVVGNDGVERPVDAIIFGTGFRPTDSPAAQRLIGREGKSLSEAWGGSPQAYLGTTVSGFPNLFILLGPNTGLGHTSVVYMIEAQIAHVMDALRYMERHDVGAMEPKAEAQAAFIRGIDERMRGTVWVAGGCKSWYLDVTGRNSTLWPDFTWQYRRRVERIDPSAYRMTRANGAARVGEALERAREYTREHIRERAYA
jgi:cation diffusion facilitator CzcD-associated flavoprotein CzcO